MTIVYLKAKDAPKSARSAMQTLLFTSEEVALWRLPAFQRPLRVNEKVRGLVEDIKERGGLIPGVLTLGKLQGDRATFYIVDGQHRVEAFKLSGLTECIADVRIVTFETMAEMADEFVGLNSRLVAMKPDDILRGLEASTPALLKIRSACDFVGYGQIRRGTASPVIGMSILLKCWHWSNGDTPAINTTYTATRIAQCLDDPECERIVAFMQVARGAWGSDPENSRLWGTLNLTMTMWLWRQLVLNRDRGVKRAVVLNAELFRKCLMSVSTDGSYLDWLVGRTMSERDRSPCYHRLRSIFVKRIQQETGRKVLMPGPAWSSR